MYDDNYNKMEKIIITRLLREKKIFLFYGKYLNTKIIISTK